MENASAAVNIATDHDDVHAIDFLPAILFAFRLSPLAKLIGRMD